MLENPCRITWNLTWVLLSRPHPQFSHYDDVIMGTIASQITSLTSVYSTVYSDADQSKHQSSASLAFVWGIHQGPVNSPHKWPVTRKMFPFDDVIINWVTVTWFKGSMLLMTPVIATLFTYMHITCVLLCFKLVWFGYIDIQQGKDITAKPLIFTKFQNLNVSILVLQLSLRSLLKPSVILILNVFVDVECLRFIKHYLNIHIPIYLS